MLCAKHRAVRNRLHVFPVICTEYDNRCAYPILQIREKQQRSQGQAETLLTEAACSSTALPLAPTPKRGCPQALCLLLPFCYLPLKSWVISPLGSSPPCRSSVLISSPLDSSQLRSTALTNPTFLKGALHLTTHTPPPPSLPSSKSLSLLVISPAYTQSLNDLHSFFKISLLL